MELQTYVLIYGKSAEKRALKAVNDEEAIEEVRRLVNPEFITMNGPRRARLFREVVIK